MIDWLIDWLIDWIVFYAVSAIFQPYNGGNVSRLIDWLDSVKITPHRQYFSRVSEYFLSKLYMHLMGIRSRSADELLLNAVYLSSQQQRIRHFIQTEMLYSFSLIEGFTTNIFIMVQWLHRTGQNQFNKRIDIRLSLQKSIPKDVDLIRRVASTHPRAVHARFSLIFLSTASLDRLA